MNISYSNHLPLYPKRTLYFSYNFSNLLQLAIFTESWSYFARLGTLPATYLIYLIIYLTMPTNINPCHLQYISPTYLLLMPLVTFSCYLRWFVRQHCVPQLCYIFFAQFCWILNFCLKIANLAASFTFSICFISSFNYSY